MNLNPDRPHCAMCDQPFRNQNDLIVHQRACAVVAPLAVPDIQDSYGRLFGFLALISKERAK